MKNRKTLYLASTSPRRQELIHRLGLPVEIVANKAEETIDLAWTPAEAVEQLSKVKAKAADQHLKTETELSTGQGMQRTAPDPSGILIGADTVVVLDNHILGKPTDEAHAKEMLTALQGRTHEVLTGITLIDLALGEPMDQAGNTKMPLGDNCQYQVVSKYLSGKPKMIIGHSVSKVTFKSMSNEEIQAYVHTGEPLDKAGSYGVQGVGALFVEKIEGDFFSIMGLPLNMLYEILTSEFEVKSFV